MDTLVRQFVEAVTVGSPVARSMGVELTSLEVDVVTLRLPYADDLATTPGIVHGGVIAALIDIAGATCSASGIAPDDGATGGATSHLSVTYLAPTRSDMCAEARTVHRSRSTTQTEVRVRDVDGRLVATGQVSSRIFH
jgi:uncharacterized protein (TIGR00369 family)